MARQLQAPYALPTLQPLDDPEAAVKRKLRTAAIALAILLIGLLGSAAFVPIGGAVIGSGEVSVASKVKLISHPTGGVLAEMRVREGDRVRKGDILMRLDTTVSGASAAYSRETVDQLLAQRARLEAEREDRERIDFPPELAARADAAAKDAMASQARLFQLRKAELNGQRLQLEERIRQLEQQIHGYARQITSLNRQLAIIEPEKAGLRELWNKRLVNISRLNEVERTAVDLGGNVAALDARIAEARARISETREQIIGLRRSSRSDAGAELGRVAAQLSVQKIESVSAGDAFERSIIRAPSGGVIDKLAFTTIGGVIPAGQQILQIVPQGDELTVEGRISPADIDQVRLGQPVRVHFSAFNVQTTYEAPGELVFVSPERAVDDRTGTSFYRIRVDVTETGAARRESLKLVPGMPAEFFIQTGSRSMLSYITKPLRDQFARAFRDG